MSKYFTILELSRSETAQRRGIVNTPNNDIVRNLDALAEQCLDKIRDLWGKPLGVNSGYRCPALNKAVGGAATSQHLRGEAADITTGAVVDNVTLFNLITKSGIAFDQLILENGGKWLHVSYANGRNRRQIIKINK